MVEKFLWDWELKLTVFQMKLLVDLAADRRHKEMDSVDPRLFKDKDWILYLPAQKQLQELQEMGWLLLENNVMKTTPKGCALAKAILHGHFVNRIDELHGKADL